MALKSLRRCNYPGCPNLTRETYCPEHKKYKHIDYDKRRPSASKRGYTRLWRKVRRAYLRAHPLCELCLKRGLTVPAEEVHHIIPLSQGGTHAFSNLQALCKSCHSSITARESKGIGGRKVGSEMPETSAAVK